MNPRPKIIQFLGILIIIASAIAASAGIFTTGGPGEYSFLSIRDQVITIYGKGLYRHMSADVAIQGIAQDYVTLFLAIPLLAFALIFRKKNTLRSKTLLSGVLLYFFLTYLFYMNMAMYNAMFIVYILLTGMTFFALALSVMDFDLTDISSRISVKMPVKFIGGFLIVLSSSIAVLWLQIIVTPLLDGTVIPPAAEHYTTLTVQGFDLSLFLPLNIIAGILLIRRNAYGYMLSGILLVFLVLLMGALVAKIVAMALAGVNVIPVIVIIPCFELLTVFCTYLFLRNLKDQTSRIP